VLAEDCPSGGFALGQLGLSFEDRSVKPDAVHSVLPDETAAVS